MKSERHRKILEIINKNDIETQEELAAALIDAGFNVTQATVSRDIKCLISQNGCERTQKVCCV